TVADQTDDGCALFGTLVTAVATLASAGAFAPVAGSAALFLCKGAAARASQRDSTNPDLQVQLGTADGSPYVTETAHNVTQVTFGSSFLVPTGAIPADGLIVKVVDVDPE